MTKQIPLTKKFLLRHGLPVGNLCKFVYKTWGDQIRQSIKETKRTGNETGFIFCTDDLSKAKLCYGGTDSGKLESDCKEWIGAFHTHPDIITNVRSALKARKIELTPAIVRLFVDKRLSQRLNDFSYVASYEDLTESSRRTEYKILCVAGVVAGVNRLSCYDLRKRPSQQILNEMKLAQEKATQFLNTNDDSTWKQAEQLNSRVQQTLKPCILKLQD